MRVDKFSQGIVIDHIRPKLGYKIFEYLRLYEADYPVALIINVDSNKYGRKDILKIQNIMDLDLHILGFLDPNITINIIKDENIEDKIKMQLPEQIAGVVKCVNPDCISNKDRSIINVFELVNRESGKYRCSYCDKKYNWEDKVEYLISNLDIYGKEKL